MIGMQKILLATLARRQADPAAGAGGGHTADTVYRGHEKVLRQTVAGMSQGARLAEYNSPGAATVQVLHGRVRMISGGLSWEARTGDLLIVPEACHSLEAVEDSAVLLDRGQAGNANTLMSWSACSDPSRHAYRPVPDPDGSDVTRRGCTGRTRTNSRAACTGWTGTGPDGPGGSLPAAVAHSTARTTLAGSATAWSRSSTSTPSTRIRSAARCCSIRSSNRPAAVRRVRTICGTDSSSLTLDVVHPWTDGSGRPSITRRARSARSYSAICGAFPALRGVKITAARSNGGGTAARVAVTGSPAGGGATSAGQRARVPCSSRTRARGG